jgi:hypothetical protein
MWGIAAIMALLWPGRTAGPLDGLPLDRPLEALLLGIAVPTLLWFHPAFLRTRLARVAVVVLLAWKAFAVAALVPDGWCVRFEPGRPLVRDATSPVPHSWDVRADWLDTQPACSAVMRRAYTGIGEFPVWFFNLPPAGDGYPVAGDRPPTARTAMAVSGFLDVARAGDLRIELGDDHREATAILLDGALFANGGRVEPGTHRVRIESMLTGEWWRFEPLWNGGDLWSSRAIATLRRPSPFDAMVRPAGSWLITLTVAVWLIAWIASFTARIGSPIVLGWMIIASTAFAALALDDRVDVARWCVLALAAAVWLPVPSRLRNLTGVAALIGIPWLVLVAASGAGQVGRFSYYAVGHDYWTFQRYAYRTVLQGYWLEGGSAVFWFQPLYRWIVGVLHLLFGDSSVGERFWDGACVLTCALFSWHVADRYAGFRAGLLAAVVTLSVFALGTPWPLIGIGLGEITSAGFLALAAVIASRSRRGPWTIAVAAGLVGTLAFYTRLNNGPMAVCIVLFALPARTSMRQLMTTLPWRLPFSWRSVAIIPAVIAVGLLLFTWRTWHYTGVFNPLYGTSHKLLAIWQPGMPAATALRRGIGSAMMVVTVNDPAQWDWRALPVLAGAGAAVLAILGLPGFRDLPAAPVVFFAAGLLPAFIARGWAYSGRFSVHLIAVCCALAVCAVSRLVRPRQSIAHGFGT